MLMNGVEEPKVTTEDGAKLLLMVGASHYKYVRKA